jgi:hypothetical protein
MSDFSLAIVFSFIHFGTILIVGPKDVSNHPRNRSQRYALSNSFAWNGSEDDFGIEPQWHDPWPPFPRNALHTLQQYTRFADRLSTDESGKACSQEVLCQTDHEFGHGASPTHFLLCKSMSRSLNFLKPRLVLSRSTIIIPLYNRVIFVRLLNGSEFSSRLSKISQALDVITGMLKLFDSVPSRTE